MTLFNRRPVLAGVFLFLFLTCFASGKTSERKIIVPPNGDTAPVSKETMQRIYEEVKTPHKYGIILKGEEEEKVDCPSVFRHGSKWYMMYIAIKSRSQKGRK